MCVWFSAKKKRKEKKERKRENKQTQLSGFELSLLRQLLECVYLNANRFSMAWEKGIQVPFLFFVFAWHWKNRFEFCFLFFVFALTLKKRFCTLYFVFRFRITLKTDINFSFCFSFSHYFEKQIWISFVIFAWLEKGITAPVQSFEAPATPSGWDRGIYFLCNWK